MRKVIIINHYGSAPGEVGTTRHFDIASRLSENKNLKVEYWICGYNHFTGEHHSSMKSKLKFVSNEDYNGLKVVRIKSLPYRKKNSMMRQFNISLFSLLSALLLLFKSDVRCCVISFPPLSFINVFVTKLKRIPLVIDIEDLWPLFLYDMGLKNKVIISIMERIANYAYNKANMIDAVSEGMLTFAKQKVKNNKEKDFFLCPLGVDIKQYDPANQYDLRDIMNKEWFNKFKIIYIGAFNPANDLISVLKVAEKMKVNPEISFILIGDGGEKERLLKYRKDNNLLNAYIEDPINSNEVPKYLSCADICLTNLKRIESFKLVRPNKLFQYMAMAKPILSGIDGEFKKILTEANAGYSVDFNDSQSVKSVILSMYNNKESIKLMGENGRKYIEKHGDRDKITNEYINKITKKYLN